MMKNRLGSFRSNANLSNFSIRSLLLVGARIVLFPLGIVGVTSLIPVGQTLEGTIFHHACTSAIYREAQLRETFLVAFIDSTLVAIVVTALAIFTSTLAGHVMVISIFLG
ncbi:hypothetical protein HC931_07130 [Candidatus Gracilibacteria bacterium]|nr:hypothetical protein [Candidatus Gracilibacteria bacterium]NJM85910.1 hypothetical protein [Hydrococcus sp. RU_2_2]NJP18750.1 hypothetical protein [Hydrococcus sp. CRU_1_1]